MDDILKNLKKRFPSLPQNSLKKIYQVRCERLRLLMIMNIPVDLRWLIEAKVRLTGEFSDSLISYMPGLGKSSFSKKTKSKTIKCLLQVCTHDLQHTLPHFKNGVCKS